MHIRLERQGQVLREIDKPHLFLAAKAAGLPLASIGTPPDVAAYDFHFARELDASEQAQFETLFRAYDPATADSWQIAQAAAKAARKTDLRPLRDITTVLEAINADKTLAPDATALQLREILERILTRQAAIVKALARLIEREIEENE